MDYLEAIEASIAAKGIFKVEFESAEKESDFIKDMISNIDVEITRGAKGENGYWIFGEYRGKCFDLLLSSQATAARRAFEGN